MKPARNARHLRLVRALPCCYCAAPAPSDAHHWGPRGVGQKTSDYRTVPLCRRCHDGFHASGALGNMTAEDTRWFFLRTQVEILERRIEGELDSGDAT